MKSDEAESKPTQLKTVAKAAVRPLLNFSFQDPKGAESAEPVPLVFSCKARRLSKLNYKRMSPRQAGHNEANSISTEHQIQDLEESSSCDEKAP